MTLFQIFFWFLKLNDVSYELRSLYNSNPQYDYKDYYANNSNNLFIKTKPLHDFFNERVKEYQWGPSQIQWIFDDILGYNRSMCSLKLKKAIKKWSRFIKNNVKLDLNVGDTVELPFYYWCDCDAGKYGVIKGLSEDNRLLNVELSNKIIRIVPIFDIKSINGEEPLFYIKFNKKIYNGAE